MVTRPHAALALSRSAMAGARWLVLAPHADDETLGTGALIADAAARNVFAGVVILTDGAGSHGHDGPRSQARLIAARRSEAALAVKRLAGADAPAPVHLDWPDAHPFRPGEAGFESARRRLAALCRARQVDALAVTAGHEPHCDHDAAFRLAQAVAGSAMRPIRVFEYIVWARHPPEAGYRTLRTKAMLAGRRSQALAAHRSQLTPQFGDGFRLSAQKRRMPDFDLLYTMIDRHARTP